MRASEFFAVRPHLERAVVDVRDFLNGEKENEKNREESSELYDLMEANETPPDVKGQGRPELTPEHYAALKWRTADGDPITDAQREAILDEVLPGQPMSDAGLAALERAWRGGWRESSRQAAVWLRNAGETVAADGIDWALSRLRGEPKDAAERSQHRDAMRTAAEYVLTILTTCLASGGAVADGRDESGDADGDVSRSTDNQPLSRLLSVFTNGLSDERIQQASTVLQDDKLTTNERLEKIDRLIRFPATASAEQLGQLLGVTKQAVLKSNWWIQNRRGEKANEIGRRRNVHKQRAAQLETTQPRDKDD